uniref:Uncharacterized protein n=1 Tax=Cyprinus carpio TaxID=7962 RepID=A0A8C1GEV5_CYPCA
MAQSIFSSSKYFCNKCKNAEGTLIHCFWECFKVQQLWSGVFLELKKISCCPLQLGPTICLLGLTQELPYVLKVLSSCNYYYIVLVGVFCCNG